MSVLGLGLMHCAAARKGALYWKPQMAHRGVPQRGHCIGNNMNEVKSTISYEIPIDAWKQLTM